MKKSKNIMSLLPGSRDSGYSAANGAPDSADKSTSTAKVAEVGRTKPKRGSQRGTGSRGRDSSDQSRYDPAEGVSIFEVKPFHLGMFQGEELAAVQFRFSEFFSAIDVPMRILALSEPYSLQGAVDAAQEMVLSTADEWRRDGLKQYRRFMEELRASTDLHGIKYYLQAWLPQGLPDTTVQGLATGAFMTRVSPVETTEPFFRGSYIEERAHLAPLSPGEPFMCVLTSWDLRGSWDLYTVHDLLQLPFPVGVAIDVYTYPPDRAHVTLMNSYNALEAQLSTTGRMGRDTKSEAAWADCDYAMKAVDAGQRLHRVTVALLVKGKTRSTLHENVHLAERVLASKLRFRIERGNQLEALKLFTTTRTRHINLKLTQRTAISEGVSVLVPFGLRRRNDTRGILWGIDADGGYPVFYDGWTRQNGAGGAGGATDEDMRSPIEGAPDARGARGARGASGASAYHHVIVGETGSGKTYGANLLLYREALRGTQVVVLEPMGHSRRLMQAMGEGGSYNRVDFAHTTLNVLDVVESTLTDQVTHVQRTLSVLLSSASGAGGVAAASLGGGWQALTGRADSGGGHERYGGHTAGRRVFSNAELAALGAALRDLYTGIDPDTIRPEETPRLEQLCTRLRLNDARAGSASCGRALAEEIAGLYVDGVYGDVFNPKDGTSLNLLLTSPGVAYDFSRVNDTFRPLLYSQVLAAVQRRIRSPKREQPMIVFIDEFRYMAQEPMLAEQAMLLVKTARTYRAAIWMAEQNLFTFSETFTGRAIIENTPLITLYRQTATATKIARDLYPKLTEYHAFLMGTSQRGECVTLLGDDIFHMHMQSSRGELAVFAGS
jgi:hypothetical protein